MASPAFVAGDFKIFDVKGFKPRMTEIRARVRPKLDAFGGSLTSAVSRSVGTPGKSRRSRRRPRSAS